MRRDDAQHLWRRFGEGDQAAFAALYRTLHTDVIRYCRSLLHDEQDAADAAQTTWTALWASDAARRDVPLRPWLFRVAHNEAVTLLRRRRGHEELGDDLPPAPDDTAAHVEHRERLATLQADLHNLPERQRSALLLRELVGLEHAEIAAVFDISPHAAKQTIYEARRGLIEAERGRETACCDVQQAISDADGRVLRGRWLRAHLRGCASCRAFEAAVGRQREEIRALFPPAAGLAALGGVLGAGAGASAGGTVVATGAGAAGGSVAAKVAVAAAIAVGAVAGQQTLLHPEGAPLGTPPAAGAVPAAAARSAAPARAATPALAALHPAAARTTSDPPVPASRRTAPRPSGSHRAASPREPAAAPPAPSASLRAPAAAPEPAAETHDLHRDPPQGNGKAASPRAEPSEKRGSAAPAPEAAAPSRGKPASSSTPPGAAGKPAPSVVAPGRDQGTGKPQIPGADAAPAPMSPGRAEQDQAPPSRAADDRGTDPSRGEAGKSGETPGPPAETATSTGTGTGKSSAPEAHGRSDDKGANNAGKVPESGAT